MYTTDLVPKALAFVNEFWFPSQSSQVAWDNRDPLTCLSTEQDTSKTVNAELYSKIRVQVQL